MKFIDEDCPGIVPLKRLVQKENVEYNGSCRVRWSNGKIYQAFLICSGVKFVCIFSLIVCILCLNNAITLQLIGTMEECSVRQDEIDGPDSEHDQESISEKQVKVCFLNFAILLIFETYLNFASYCLYKYVCLYLSMLSFLVYGNEHGVHILLLMIYFA